MDVPTAADKEALRSRISCLQQALIDRLSVFLEERKDFAIDWDFDYYYHVCGGIYTEAAVSRNLLEGITAALATDLEPMVWTFHAAVETDGVDGEFFVRNGEVVYLDDGPDFLELMG